MGLIVAVCGGLEVAQPVKQKALSVRKGAPTLYRLRLTWENVTDNSRDSHILRIDIQYQNDVDIPKNKLNKSEKRANKINYFSLLFNQSLV